MENGPRSSSVSPETAKDFLTEAKEVLMAFEAMKNRKDGFKHWILDTKFSSFTLVQLVTAVRVKNSGLTGNWSEAGAGKSRCLPISLILANISAAVIIAPANVETSWRNCFSECLSEDGYTFCSKAEDLVVADSKLKVLFVSYNKCSLESEVVKKLKDMIS